MFANMEASLLINLKKIKLSYKKRILTDFLKCLKINVRGAVITGLTGF